MSNDLAVPVEADPLRRAEELLLSGIDRIERLPHASPTRSYWEPWLTEVAAWREQVADRRSRPRAAVVEIVERARPGVDPDEGPGILIPDEVRINGVPLLVVAGRGPVVERIDTSGGRRDPVMVTMTLFARRVVVDAEVTEA